MPSFLACLLLLCLPLQAACFVYFYHPVRQIYVPNLSGIVPVDFLYLRSYFTNPRDFRIMNQILIYSNNNIFASYISIASKVSTIICVQMNILFV